MAGKLSPERARAIGRIGGLTTSATTDSLERLRPAHDAFMRKFDHEVDPHRQLTETERCRRAEAARKLYFYRLALRANSAKERSRLERLAQTAGADA